MISLNRPKGANSLSRSLVESLENSLHTLSQDHSIRVLIVRSLVRNIFCAGADLKERAVMPNKEVPHFVARLRQLTTKLHEFQCPTIAAIDGAALGGGLELALGADIRVASSNARIGLVETKLAIIPGAGGTQRLPRLLPIALAKELIFTGRVLNGTQALEINLVNYSMPQNDAGDAAYQKALEVSQEILSSGPIALRAAKLAINKGSDVDLNNGLAIEGACYLMTVGTKDRREGMQAFIEKRLPQYVGE